MMARSLGAALFLAACLRTEAGLAGMEYQAGGGGTPWDQAARAQGSSALAMTQSVPHHEDKKVQLCKDIGCEAAYDHGASCQCNLDCRSYGNCCADYGRECPAQDKNQSHWKRLPRGAENLHPANRCYCDKECKIYHNCCKGCENGYNSSRSNATAPKLWAPNVSKVVEFDIYRAMPASGVDMRPMEDDDVADLGGVLKYIVTEIIVESQKNPHERTRKNGINSITKHRFKIRNPDSLVDSGHIAYGEFGQFVTYDSGRATNKDQEDMLKKYGDFVGVQGCPHLHCDRRLPSDTPYSWFSLGNWCPNLPFWYKGTKEKMNETCLKDLNDTVLSGGLCPKGFGADSLSPPMDPTGKPGCVYSYGRGETVLLDELAGITQEDCGGERCRDWLHFRLNCTNEKYKQKFDLTTGQVVHTDYCVEHDIHPRCQNDCFDPDCQAVLGSGGAVYLGLPFWSDICSPRANSRRMERVAYALGTEGALSKHQVVDGKLAKAACPTSVGGSNRCVPEDPGRSGPFCSRHFNGACEPCFVPGTVKGPDARPACPLDIYETYRGYWNTSGAEKPKCKSKKASEGCCLYDGSCEGDSDPETADLDADGYALVAGKQSTEDMATFLTRAVNEMYPEFKYLLDDEDEQEQVSYAAYGAWGRQPANQSLHDAVQEFGRNLKVQEFLARPNRTVLPLAKGLLPWQCFQLAVAFAPLDMEGVAMSQEQNASACQLRCQRVEGCTHFTFVPPPGHQDGEGSCHLQDVTATPVDGSTGHVAGPYKCWAEIEASTRASLVDIGYQTYVTKDLACMKTGLAYTPRLWGTHPEVISGSTREESIELCRGRCHKTTNCSHFSMAFPAHLCSLSPRSAVTYHSVGSVSGPSLCKDKDKAEPTYWELYDASEPGEPRAAAWAQAAPLLCGIGAVAALASVLLRRPCRARSSDPKSRSFARLAMVGENDWEREAAAASLVEAGLRSVE